MIDLFGLNNGIILNWLNYDFLYLVLFFINENKWGIFSRISSFEVNFKWKYIYLKKYRLEFFFLWEVRRCIIWVYNGRIGIKICIWYVYDEGESNLKFNVFNILVLIIKLRFYLLY